MQNDEESRMKDNSLLKIPNRKWNDALQVPTSNEQKANDNDNIKVITTTTSEAARVCRHCTAHKTEETAAASKKRRSEKVIETRGCKGSGRNAGRRRRRRGITVILLLSLCLHLTLFFLLVTVAAGKACSCTFDLCLLLCCTFDFWLSLFSLTVRLLKSKVETESK